MKSNNKHVSTSKFLSLVPRHRPEVIGAKLDPDGWLCIDHLQEKLVGINRETKLVRQCCMVMMEAFVATYLDSKKT